MNLLKLKLHWQVLLALILAAVAGLLLRIGGTPPGGFTTGFIATCDFIGTLFLNALKMIMVPLIISTVIVGIASLGSGRDFGRLGGKTLLYYTTTSLLAVVTGLFFVNLIGPGRVAPDVAQSLLGQAESAETIMARVGSRSASDLVDIFLRMVPPNIFQAATDNGQLLGLITISVLFGFFIARLPDRHRATQVGFWESVQALMLRITDFVICFAPLGVFALVAPILANTGFGLFRLLLLFAGTVLLGLAWHFFVNLGLLLRLFGGFNPIRNYVAMTPVLVTAFSTASSSATLPVTLETVQKNAGVSSRTASFVLPLGATVNMDGTALYECVVVVFLAQIYGVLTGFEFAIGEQVVVVILALLTSIGVAGIPAASLVAILLIMGAVGLPTELLGVVMATDRILDMCRTSVNVFSDTCGAVIIARSDGERGVHARPAPAGGV